MIHDCWFNEKHLKLLSLNPMYPTAGDMIRVKHGDDEIYIKVEKMGNNDYSSLICPVCPLYKYHCRIHHHCSNRISVVPCRGSRYKLVRININKILEDL